MRMLSKLVVGSAATAALIGIAAGPAFADPPSGVVPRATDAVGTGSNTTQYLVDQLGHDFDGSHSTASTKLYSWDAVNPSTLAIGDNIVTKSGCAALPRPNGSTAGIETLDANAKDPKSTSHYCEDFARSSRGRSSSDPAFGPGGVAFVSLAGDAVTWASRSAAAGGTDAPASLTVSQLAGIYECSITNWKAVGGKDAPIKVFIPQTTSGTRSFWLTALGGGTTPIIPGSCANDLPTTKVPDGTMEENQGINPALNNAETIYIYSVGAYLSQKYHSPACANKNCTPVSGKVCKTPSKGQNLFGCNETGVLQLNEIAGSKPTMPFPLTSGTATAKINTGFDISFQRTLYDVVRYDSKTSDHIPGGEPGSPGGLNLEQLFGASGYFCTNSTAKTDISHYGFLSSWPLGRCGGTS